VRQKTFKWAAYCLICFLVFLLVGGAFVFLIHRPDGHNYAKQAEPQRFLGAGTGPDKAVIIEERAFSGISRINLIENARESIQIAYHAVHDGLASDMFYGLILEAAGRDVQVQLLFDGIFHNLYWREKATYWALVDHPNIEIRFYEPLNLLKPWTLNNRMHDKFMVIDNKYALLGGRNIGDQYFMENCQGKMIKDRDVLLYNTAPDALHESVLSAFGDYFDLLWCHSYTVEKHENVPSRQQLKARQRHQLLLDNLAVIRQQHPEYFGEKIDWEQYAYSTSKVSLITNPIQRMNKEPWILSEIAAIYTAAEDTILLQSPYIIPSRHIKSYVDSSRTKAEVYYLTNSKASSANYFAIAGYLKHRDRLAEQATQIYEYHGPGSIHAKTYVFDMRLSVIGSFNMDARSSFLSTESMVVIDSEMFAEELAQSMKGLAKQSVPYIEEAPSFVAHTANPQPVPWHKTVLVWLLRIMLYPFDALL